MALTNVLFVLIFVISYPYGAQAGGGIVATGGTITTSGGNTIHTFTSSGTFTVTSGNGTVNYLVVAGGGGGGSFIGGGGGAGGMRTGTLAVTPQAYTVTVGAGGAVDANGNDSVFSTITSTGGGKGGLYMAGTGGSGGSGGGGAGTDGVTTSSTGGAGNTPSTSPSQGNNGGSSFSAGFTAGASGGGGAGAVGANAGASNGAAGGNGTASSISGASVTYAGGGGGGARAFNSGTGGAGGSGGGGAGGGINGTAVAGTANTGGGGGGHGFTDGVSAAAGGSGIVVISYSNAGAVTFSGNVTFNGNLAITSVLSKGSGTFAIDHPLDPANKILYHSFVESPDVKNLYDGIAKLDKNGEAKILLPAYFDALNNKIRYQFFPIGKSMPGLYIKNKEKNSGFTIGGGAAGGEVSWQVTGVRQDPYILAHPVIVEMNKGPGALAKKGECLFAPLCTRQK